MTTSTRLYGQLFDQLRQHSRVCDLRHLKALAWMVSALLCSGELNLAAWEPRPHLSPLFPGNDQNVHPASPFLG